MYANQKIEQLDMDAMREKQLQLLKQQIHWAQEKSFFYHQAFEKAGVSADDINELEDLRKFPFLQPAQIHQVDSLDILTLPISSILRFNHMQQTASEITKLYTKGDIEHNVEMMARCLVATGITNASIVAVQGDLSDSRLMDVQYALESIGATAVPMGTDYRQWLRVMELVSMDTIVTTPQLVMQLVIQMQATGKNIIDYPLARVICMNPAGIQNPMQRHIQDRTHAKVFNFYAPPELGSAGILFQCEAHSGQHVQEDYYYPEIIAFNSDTAVTEPNQMGELVLTTLQAEAMPLIRYRTGQAVSMVEETCNCGRTFRRVTTPFSFC